jgi:hypothetical protein
MIRPSRILSVTLAAAAFAPALVALDSVNDAGALGVSSGLDVSQTLSREKRAQASDGKWPLTIMGAATGGWNSNVYDSDGDDAPEVDSSFYAAAAGLRLDHNFSDNDRWRNKVEAYETVYSESGDLTKTDILFNTDYEHRFEKGLAANLGGEAQRHDAKFIDALGNELTRDAAYYNYVGTVGVDLAVGDRDSLDIDVFLQRYDYDETDGLNSIDSDKLGGEIKYRHVTDKTITRLIGDYAVKTYEEELANDVTGAESPGNPIEEHTYVDAQLWLTFKLGERFRAQTKLDYSSKTDEFEGYETWEESKGELGLDIELSGRWDLDISGYGAYRDYPERDLPSGSNLHYIKYGGDLETRFYLSGHWSLFGGYHIVFRNTNNDTGLTYRDYTVQAVSGGISAAF